MDRITSRAGSQASQVTSYYSPHKKQNSPPLAPGAGSSLRQPTPSAKHRSNVDQLAKATESKEQTGISSSVYSHIRRDTDRLPSLHYPRCGKFGCLIAWHPRIPSSRFLVCEEFYHSNKRKSYKSVVRRNVFIVNFPLFRLIHQPAARVSK